MRYLLIALALTATAAWASRNAEKDPAALNLRAAELEKAAAAAPGDASNFVKLGFVYSKLERVADARRAFETAVALDPKLPQAHYMLGLIYEKLGLRAEAIRAWQACLETTAEPRIKETAQKHLHNLRNP